MIPLHFSTKPELKLQLSHHPHSAFVSETIFPVFALTFLTSKALSDTEGQSVLGPLDYAGVVEHHAG